MAALFLAVITTSVPACAKPSLGGNAGDAGSTELERLLANDPDAPIVVPNGVRLGGANLGTVVKDDGGHVVAVEVLLRVAGEELSASQRYCFVKAGLEQLPIPDCPPLLYAGAGVEVYGAPAGAQASLRDVVWSPLAP